ATVHGAGLLHRDVKPSNILLRADGEPVLSDFGLVRDAGVSTHTQTGQFLGTSAYAPPEQLRGETVDQRCDVFGLGVTLYHALAGSLPWPDAPIYRKAALIENAAPAPLRRVSPGLPREVAAVVHKAIDPDPDRRYQTAGEFAEELERCLDDRPVLARPDGPIRRVRRHTRRHRKQVISATAGMVAALLVSLAAVTWIVVLPRWSAHELRLAREHLLNLDPNLMLVSRVYFNLSPSPERSPDQQGRPGADEVAVGIDPEHLAALGHYAASTRFGQGGRDRALEHRAARSAHEVGSGITTGAESAARWSDLPAIRVYLERMGSGHDSLTAPAIPEPPTPGSTSEARVLGMIAFLLGDYATALVAWNRFDREADADPVVEALLGELYLVMGEPALAYPRLRAAFDAFPDTRSLNAGLAEAAARVGDTARAERLVERAHSLPTPDHFGRLARIRALIFESRGDDRAALELYEGLRRDTDYYGSNPVIIEQHAGLLWRLGRYEEALGLWAAGHRSFARVDLLMRRFVEHLPVWWSGLDDAERRDRLAAAVHATRRDRHAWHKDQAPLTLPDLLFAEHTFRAELAGRPARLDEIWHDNAKAWSDPTVCTPLGEMLRVTDLEFWEALAFAPESSTQALGDAWAAGDPVAIRAAERGLDRSRSTP
ncbi:MAG: protein kinase, partial [Phycisphaerales bacterium]|nr:protein kinase [Phycisphaerales bacterium]